MIVLLSLSHQQLLPLVLTLFLFHVCFVFSVTFSSLLRRWELVSVGRWLWCSPYLQPTLQHKASRNLPEPTWQYVTANVHVWTLQLPVYCSAQSLVTHWKMLVKCIHCLMHWSAVPVNQVPGLLILKSFFNHCRSEVISITVSFVSLIYISFCLLVLSQFFVGYAYWKYC